MKKQRIYICGKVTGEPIEACINKFGQAQKILESQDFEAVNPLMIVLNGFQTTWTAAMKICIAELVKCDSVDVLEDWQKSDGAICEVVTAWMYGIPVCNHDNLARLSPDPKTIERYFEIVKKRIQG